jgi:hypothetical protein
MMELLPMYREGIKLKRQPDMVVYIYNPSYLGGESRRIISLKPAWAKLVLPHIKDKMQNVRARGMVQFIEYLPSPGKYCQDLKKRL